MLVPNHPEFYAVYHGGGQPAVVDASTYYYEPKGMMSQSGQCYIIHRSALFYLYINYYKSTWYFVILSISTSPSDSHIVFSWTGQCHLHASI